MGQRYRIIYRVEEERVLVEVVCLGLRKESDKKVDVYALAEKLHKAGLV
jgi:mRNA interferase RelE/StbE